MHTYFIADTHFNDKNIFMLRQNIFSSFTEMNHILINNWNTIVSEDDEVFILGDIGIFKDNNPIISSLNSIKYLIKGNHDIYSVDYYLNSGITSVYDYPIIYNNFFILSHEPLYVNINMPYVNIYGHIHDNFNYNKVSACGYCVSADVIDFIPISFDNIKNSILELRKNEIDKLIKSKEK